jgi:hypothetical protein
MARTLTVSHPIYGTHTRKTDRTYTHVVVSCGDSPAHAKKLADANLAGYRKQSAEYRHVQAGGQPSTAQGRQWLAQDIARDGRDVVLAQYAEYAAEAEAKAAKCEAEVTAAPARAEQRARDNAFGLVGWAGRLDLALKTAEQARRDGGQRVTILDVASGAVVAG